MIGFIGGLHHWWPKMFGKMYDENLGLTAFVLVFVGFNVVFFTQFMLEATACLVVTTTISLNSPPIT